MVVAGAGGGTDDEEEVLLDTVDVENVVDKEEVVVAVVEGVAMETRGIEIDGVDAVAGDVVGVGTSAGEPEAVTIEVALAAVVGGAMVAGSADDAETDVAIVNGVESALRELIVTVIVAMVSATAPETPAHTLYRLVALPSSSLGQSETKHCSAASPMVSPAGVVLRHRQSRLDVLEQIEAG